MNHQDLAASDRCPHCRGLLVTREDTHGRYMDCVCCGRHFPNPVEGGEPAVQSAPVPDTSWQPRTQRAQDRHWIVSGFSSSRTSCCRTGLRKPPFSDIPFPADFSRLWEEVGKRIFSWGSCLTIDSVRLLLNSTKFAATVYSTTALGLQWSTKRSFGNAIRTLWHLNGFVE